MYAIGYTVAISLFIDSCTVSRMKLHELPHSWAAFRCAHYNFLFGFSFFVQKFIFIFEADCVNFLLCYTRSIRLHNEELNDLYSSSNIVRVIKSTRMRWAGHVARMGEGGV